jgi:hypothetical protein
MAGRSSALISLWDCLRDKIVGVVPAGIGGPDANDAFSDSLIGNVDCFEQRIFADVFACTIFIGAIQLAANA